MLEEGVNECVISLHEASRRRVARDFSDRVGG